MNTIHRHKINQIASVLQHFRLPVAKSVLRPKIILILNIVIVFLVQNALSSVRSVVLNADTYSFSENSAGEIRIDIKGFGRITEPGCPQLPLKVFGIQLPERSRVLDVQIIPDEKSVVSGLYNISYALPMFASEEKSLMEGSTSDFAERKQNFLQSGSFYPENNGVFLGVDYYFDYPIVKVRYTPFSYHPEGRLLFVGQIQVDIYYEEDNPSGPIDMDGKNSMNGACENHHISNINTGLLIISSRELTEASEPFVRWKKWLGYQVLRLFIEDIETIYPGKDATEQLRNCLIEITKNNNTYRYVLLIGHLDRIPMKKLYPDPNNHNSNGEVPSDYYLAELTGNWDSDGDGYFGEFNEDAVDWSPELNIGRIPWNDPEVVSDILDRIIQYEKDKGDWKNRALLLGAISNYVNENNLSMYQTKTDGAELMEALKINIFEEVSTTSLYEKEGVASSSFACDQPLNHETLFSNWSSGSYGCIAWWSHSNYRRLTRKWWDIDDGDNIPESTELQKEDLISVYEYPVASRSPIVFANSCDAGWPEKVSLGREMIRSSVSGIISSSRLSYYVMGWDEISDGGNASLAYYFWQEFVSQTRTAGEAAYHSKYEYLFRFHQSWQQYHNIYTFNYYGDPTLSLKNQYPIFGGLSGSVTLESEGFADKISVDIPSIGFHAETDQSGQYIFDILVPGMYTVTFNADGMECFEQMVEVIPGEMTVLNATLSVIKESKIQLSGDNIHLPLQEGCSSQSTVIVKNSGNNNLVFQASTGENPTPWIKIDSAKHIIEPNKCDSLLIQLETLDLDHGIYRANIQFSTNAPNMPSITFPVTMDVLDTIAPGPIQDLSFILTEEDSIILNWTAPGDNGQSGQASGYEIWYSSYPLEDVTLESSELKKDDLVPGMPGSKESVVLKYSENLSGYFYIRIFDEAGLFSTSNEVHVGLSAVEIAGFRPQYMIMQNFPNPFNSFTEIRFSTAEPGYVRIAIYNARGQRVKTLLESDREPGEYLLRWDGTDDYSRPVSSGYYFYQIRAPGFTASRKMLFLK